MDNHSSVDLQHLVPIIAEAKRLAIEYRRITGRPLGVTGEIAEYEAARLLNLRLAPVRQSGYDAIRDDGTRLQIKARCILDDAKPGQRVGGIKLEKEWDAVLLVLLDSQYEPINIYEANRLEITTALLAPGSRARNERGALGVSKFKSIGTLVWTRN
ncbi:MAG: hypothetical protein K8L99_03390 [Anaerolineae bacterium]|nr:hypothetical protein [Anaerolineae bacterium]